MSGGPRSVRASAGLVTAAGLGALLVVVAVLVRAPRAVDIITDTLAAAEPRPSHRQRAFERLLESHYNASDALTPDGATLVVGDSLLMALPPAVLPGSVNQSIGGEAMTRTARRLGRIASLPRAAAVVLGGGTNDLLEGADVERIAAAWRVAVSAVPAGATLVCVGIPQGPGGALPPAAVEAANQAIARECAAKRGRTIDVTLGRGPFAADAFAADGVHLTLSGRRHMAEAIAAALADGPRA